ncbi:BcPKS16, polyketide synthase [Xylariaceae sp. FL0255]|nr:BcPKS16, polyketide synthase [Xylariaceae sp. FL0255]
MASILSMAVCGPHTRRPTNDLDRIRSFLISDGRLSELVQAICALRESWDVVTSRRKAISALPQSTKYIDAFLNWIKSGEAEILIQSQSGIVQLPLLVIIQITQYVQYLDLAGVKHAELQESLKKNAGVQGYCAGLLPAYAIVCSKTESELGKYAATALRLALAVGAYQELGDEETLSGAGTMVLRLSSPGEGDEIVSQFPGCYISAVTDPKTLSIVGPRQMLGKLTEYAQSRGLKAQDMDLRGKVHNPENMDFAMELCGLCDETPSLQFPEVDLTQLVLYSNRTGKRLQDCSLSHEAVLTILTAKCEWYSVLEAAAQDLVRTGTNTHKIACLGLGDCVPLSAFHQLNLSATKIDVSKLSRENELKHYEYRDDAIAIVGASCRLPGADSLEELWQLISQATSTCEPIRPERAPVDKTSRYSRDAASTVAKRMYGNFVDGIDQFDHGFFRNGFKEAAYMDPQQRILLEVAYEALDASGYLRRHDRNSYDNVGCFIGNSSCEYMENTSSHAPTAFTSTGTLRTFLAGRLSYYFGWKGPAEVIDTACSSSLVAINRACKAILGGECHTAIAGGVNLITGVTNFLDLERAGFLSPTGQCKPFDISADGYCRSDGAGIVVLKRLREAEMAGDNIMGVITGIATNQGGLSKSITVPDGPAQVDLFQSVLDKSGMTADHVTYVECHGTGTQVGDPIEISSVRDVFGGPTRLSQLQIGTIKGNIGHCEGAAGVAGLLKVLCMLKVGMTPPLANFKKLNPKIPSLAKDKMNIAQSAERWASPIRAACVNNYGASGSNASLICCEYRGVKDQSNITKPLYGGPVPMIVSAHSKRSLSSYLSQLGTVISKQSPNLGDLAFTLCEKRARHSLRWMTVASDTSSIRKDLTDSSKIFEVPLNSRPVVLAFGGQAKQTVALERSLYDSCPRLKHYIDICDELLTELGFSSILPAIFDNRPIADVTVLQTAMFVSQFACARCWIDSGVKVEAVIGHSLGELAALVVAGIWPLREGIRAVATRAKLMAKWGPERGVMLVVHATAIVVHDLIKEVTDCEVACYNATSTQVVVGSTVSVARLETLLQSDARYKGIRCQRVDVSHGFHSRYTTPLLEDLTSLGRTIPIQEAEIPIELCTIEQTGVLSNHVARHMRDPVYFEAAVRRIEDRLGPCVWLEAGADTPIVPMLKRAVQNKDLHKFQSITFNGATDKNTVLPNAIVNLSAENINATYWPFLTPKDLDLSIILLPSYPFNRSSAWVENVDRATELALIGNGHKDLAQPTEPPPKPPQLVIGPAISGKQKEFVINTECTRFKEVLSAHSVRNRPLCPSTLYMECAVMAAQLAGIDMSQGALCFEDLRFEHPLGINPDRVVTLTLTDAVEAMRWKFSVQSCSQTDPRRLNTTHGSGHLSLRSPPNLGAYHRMVSPLVTQVLTDSDSEKLLAPRAYGLFSQVVTYGESLRGMRQVTLLGHQAVAEVQIPTNKICNEGSTVTENCDAVMLDVIIQAAGLLVNSSDQSRPDSVLVAGSLDTVTLPLTPLFAKGPVLKVFVQFSVVDNGHMSGDIFVMESDQSLSFAVLGVGFTRIPTTRLERLLDAANAKNNAENASIEKARPQIISLASSVSVSESVSTMPIFTPATAAEGDVPKGTTNTHSIEKKIKEIIAEFTGSDPGAITADTLIVDLGLDSLAAVELAEELSTQYKRDVSPIELLDCSFKGLLEILGCEDKSIFSDSESEFTPLSASSATSVTSIETSASQVDNDGQSERFKQIIADACGAKPDTLNDVTITLGDLGVDSLATIELRSDLEAAFGVKLGDEVVAFDSTLHSIILALGLKQSSNTVLKTVTETPLSQSKINISVTTVPAPQNQSFDKSTSTIAGNPFEALVLAEEALPEKANRCGLSPRWSEVSRCLDRITVAYIIEAVHKLGVKLLDLQIGELLPTLPYLPKHSRLMERCYHMLQKHNIIECNGNVYLRGPFDFPRTPASELLASFEREFPSYKTDTNILSITGPKLAECLAGTENPIALLFRLKDSQMALKNYYINSPMLATSTELLVDLILRTIRKNHGRLKTRILEVGAGFGGTTTRLAQEFEDGGYDVEYTYTDVAPTLVSQASKTMNKYKWMQFKTLDIEKTPPESLHGQYDIVIATNCIHATSDPVIALQHVRQILNPKKGLVVLSEATHIADWFDLVFGLLDGWWLRKDGGYPLQPAKFWTRCMKNAGFATTDFSQPPLRRLNDQSLILGTVEPHNVPSRKTSGTERAQVETVVYKQVEGVQISADIYIPREQPESHTMSLAMLIHGGGHMTLSRKAIRPAQVNFLIDHGVLPISFDYRLCPQVNLIDGPIADIRDAYRWMQNELPSIICEKTGITVDPTRISVIGWSTGGHLAMSTSWTSKSLGITPPRSILSFYGPTDFQSGALDVPRLHGLQNNKVDVGKILKSLPETAITTHGEDERGMMGSNDPRNALVRSLFQQGHGLSLLLNDLRASNDDYAKFLQSPPDPSRIAAISPLARLKSGSYDTPTYIVHGTQDERVPFATAVEFVRTSREEGIDCGFLAVPGVRHLHDLSLVSGTSEWEAQVAPAYRFVLESLRL